MEIPSELKSLYKHWGKHIQHKMRDLPTDIKISTNLQDFIAERMKIWEKKYKKEKPPYTEDEILKNYRFCNIYRELDRQTIEIHKDLKSLENDFPLWLLNLAFHRFICKPETVKEIGKLSFDKQNNTAVYKQLLELPRPKYGGAYVFPISIIQKSEYPTRESFFCQYLPKIILKIANEIETFENVTVNKALKRILPIFGFNFRFHWTEILIDITYQFPSYINLFKDFHIGPGAIPTLRDLSKTQDLTEVTNDLVNIELTAFPYLTYGGKPVQLSAENWEGIACEFRKYSNLKRGRGRKRKYS
jgi:hypothetical protein